MLTWSLTKSDLALLVLDACMRTLGASSCCSTSQVALSMNVMLAIAAAPRRKVSWDDVYTHRSVWVKDGDVRVKTLKIISLKKGKIPKNQKNIYQGLCT